MLKVSGKGIRATNLYPPVTTVESGHLVLAIVKSPFASSMDAWFVPFGKRLGVRPAVYLPPTPWIQMSPGYAASSAAARDGPIVEPFVLKSVYIDNTKEEAGIAGLDVPCFQPLYYHGRRSG